MSASSGAIREKPPLLFVRPAVGLPKEQLSELFLRVFGPDNDHRSIRELYETGRPNIPFGVK